MEAAAISNGIDLYGRYFCGLLAHSVKVKGRADIDACGFSGVQSILHGFSAGRNYYDHVGLVLFDQLIAT